MKDAEFAALLAGLKEPVRKLTANKFSDALAYWKGYSDAIDEVRRAYVQAEGKGDSHDQANP